MRLILTFLIVIIAFASYSQEVFRVNSIEIEGNKVTKRAKLGYDRGTSCTN